MANCCTGVLAPCMLADAHQLWQHLHTLAAPIKAMFIPTALAAFAHLPSRSHDPLSFPAPPPGCSWFFVAGEREAITKEVSKVASKIGLDL